MRRSYRNRPSHIAWAAGLAAQIALCPVPGFTQSPLHDTPSGPRALPGDVLPPFGMLGPDGAFHPTPETIPGLDLGPNRPPETTVRGPSFALAMEAAEAALHACEADGYRVGVAVIDSAGQARVLLNADGTDGSHGFVAMRKAEAALALNMPSSEANRRMQSDPALLKRLTPVMLVDGGAVPIAVGGTVWGAIGVSGAAGKVIGAQDEICAVRGRAAIAGKLH